MANFDYFDALLPLLGLAVGGATGGKLGAATGLAAVSSGMGTVADVRKERQREQEARTQKKRIQLEAALPHMGPGEYDKAAEALYGPGAGAEAARRRRAEEEAQRQKDMLGRIKTPGPNGLVRITPEGGYEELVPPKPAPPQRGTVIGPGAGYIPPGRIKPSYSQPGKAGGEAPKPRPMSQKDIVQMRKVLSDQYDTTFMEVRDDDEDGTPELAFKNEYMDPTTGKPLSFVPKKEQYIREEMKIAQEEYLSQFGDEGYARKPTSWETAQGEYEQLPTRTTTASTPRGLGRDVRDVTVRDARPRIAMQPQAPAAPPIVQPQPSVAAQPDTAVPAMAAKPRIRPEMIGGAQAPAAPPEAPAREQDLARLRALKTKYDTMGLTDTEAQEVRQINARLSQR